MCLLAICGFPLERWSFRFLQRHNLPRLNQEEIEIWIDESQVLKLEMWFKNFQKQKSRTRWIYRWMLSNIQRRVNTYSAETFPKKFHRKKNSQVHSMRPPSPWYRNRTKYYKKRKLQANIIDEHRFKIFQQNIIKLNLTIF